MPSISIVDLQTGHFRGRLERSQSVTQESMQSWWASRVHGQGSTQEPGGSEGSWSVRQMKHRRGASGCRGAAMAEMASGGRGGLEVLESMVVDVCRSRACLNRTNKKGKEIERECGCSVH